MIVPPPQPPSSPADTESDTDHSEEEEDAAAAGASVEELMAQLKAQTYALSKASKQIEIQLTGVYARAKENLTEWLEEPLEPQTRAVAKWLRGRGLPARPTLEQMMEAALDVAVSLDLETRVVTFKPEDAAVLTGGQRRVTVFELLATLPKLLG